jgi:hypothetical protein
MNLADLYYRARAAFNRWNPVFLRRQIIDLKRQVDEALSPTLEGHRRQCEYRLFRENFREFKLTTAHLCQYLRASNLLNRREELDALVRACEHAGAVDPELQGLTKKGTLLAIQARKLAQQILRGHNPETSTTEPAP